MLTYRPLTHFTSTCMTASAELTDGDIRVIHCHLSVKCAYSETANIQSSHFKMLFLSSFHLISHKILDKYPINGGMLPN